MSFDNGNLLLDCFEFFKIIFAGQNLPSQMV